MTCTNVSNAVSQMIYLLHLQSILCVASALAKTTTKQRGRSNGRQRKHHHQAKA